MTQVVSGTTPGAASPASWFLLAAAAAPLLAQAPPPFAPPVVTQAFTLSGTAAVLDVNRDGSDDVLCPSLFWGSNATSFDENGHALKTKITGPVHSFVPGSQLLPSAIAMAAGDLDGDSLPDLISVSNAGGVHVHRNLGATRLDASAFAPDVLVDILLAGWPISPPFVGYVFPRIRTADFDGDGRMDFLLAGGPLDRWGGATRPGFLGFYRQRSDGGFDIHRQPLSGCTIDMDVADLDRDGILDHVVVVVETGALGAFTHDVLHFAFVGGQLVASAPTFNLTPGRCSAFALADVAGDANLDYVFAHTVPNGNSTYCLVQWFAGNGQGGMYGAASGLVALPMNATGQNDFLPAIVAGDWDRDGNDDLAILRGYTTMAATATSTTSPGTTELLIACGPGVTTAPWTVTRLPGYHAWSSITSPQFPLLPLHAQPGLLRTVDFAGDGSLDLLVTGLRPSTPGGKPVMVTMQNLTPPQVGDAGLHRLGQASGGDPAWPARLGFEGGRPFAGNSKFAATLLNVRAGSFAALVWGDVGIENLFSTYGIDVHIAPINYFMARYAAGSGAGDGYLRESLPIPYLPALAGDAGWFQWAYWEPVAGTYGGTHATKVRIAP